MSAPVKVPEFPLEEEYKKKTGIKRQDIEKLRKWLDTQPHLPGQHITELDLILIYHCCDRSAEVSKQVLDLHFTLRTLFGGLFKDRIVEKKIELALSTVLLLPLKMRSYDGSAALYTRVIDPDTKKFVYSDVIRSVLMVIDLWQYEEGTWPGFIIVVDMQGVTLGHLARLDVHTLQQFFYYLQEAMLVKLKGLHFLNAPSFMDRFLMIIKPFMKKELLDTMTIHQAGTRSLDKHYPMEGLPKGAGGDYLTFEDARDQLVERVKANADWFKEENRKRVVESKRPGKPKTITDIFGGIEGSFKKLDID